MRDAALGDDKIKQQLTTALPGILALMLSKCSPRPQHQLLSKKYDCSKQANYPAALFHFLQIRPGVCLPVCELVVCLKCCLPQGKVRFNGECRATVQLLVEEASRLSGLNFEVTPKNRGGYALRFTLPTVGVDVDDC